MFFVIDTIDTDHFSALDRQTTAGMAFEKKRAVHGGEFFITVITVITVEEVMRG
jgi:hypothetical protein